MTQVLYVKIHYTDIMSCTFLKFECHGQKATIPSCPALFSCPMYLVTACPSCT